MLAGGAAQNEGVPAILDDRIRSPLAVGARHLRDGLKSQEGSTRKLGVCYAASVSSGAGDDGRDPAFNKATTAPQQISCDPDPPELREVPIRLRQLTRYARIRIKAGRVTLIRCNAKHLQIGDRVAFSDSGGRAL